jgi:hypothetical protein
MNRNLASINLIVTQRKRQQLQQCEQVYPKLLISSNIDHGHFELGKKEEIEQAYRWMDEISYVDAQANEHQVLVPESLETKPGDQGDRQTTKFKPNPFVMVF